MSDGLDNAPTGTPQVPHLLDGYGSNLPSWSVAGVDYAVGYPTGTNLKNPATISMSGVSVNTTAKIVTVTGSNVTLDGYDFSLNGGWAVVVQGANDSIVDSKFLVGANHHAPILGLQSATDLHVSYCVIDGNNDGNVGGLIEMRGHGSLSVEYSWLKNAGGDMIQLHTNGPTDVTIQYNLVQNAGMSAGAHGDYTEFIGGPFTAHINYNTTMQAGGTTQGFMVEPDIGSNKGVITSGEIGHNTFTAQGGGLSYFTAVTVADVVNSFTVHDNYFDKSHIYGFAINNNLRGGPYDGSAKTSYVHNVNMVSGAVEQDSGAWTGPRRQ